VGAGRRALFAGDRPADREPDGQPDGQYKDFGESNREVYSSGQQWLDRELSDGRPFIVGGQISMADICALSTVDFAHWIGLPIDEDRLHLTAWHERMQARPSAAA